MRKTANLRILLVFGFAFWTASGASFADETIELGTYYPSLKGDMNSVTAKETIILDPQSDDPGDASQMAGTLYYRKRGSDTGLYYSDGTAWISLTSRLLNDTYTVTLTKQGNQVTSNAVLQSGTVLSVPGWSLNPSNDARFSLTDASAYPYGVKIDLQHQRKTFYSILWGGTILVDGVYVPSGTKSGVYVSLEACPYTNGRCITIDKTTAALYDTSCPGRSAPNDSTTSWDNATCGAGGGHVYTVCSVVADHLDQSGNPQMRYAECMTASNKLYQYFRIRVSRDGDDNAVIAKIMDGAFSIEVTKQSSA